MKFKLLFASALLAASSSVASAATVIVNHVYNPANLLQGSLLGEALISPVMLGVGDTLDLTLTFMGGSTIIADGEDGFWGLLLTSTGPSASLQTTGTLEFLGASDNVVSGPIALAQENSFVHLGSYYPAALYRLDNAQISFSGMRQIVTINADDIGTEREYQRVALTYFQGDVRSAVPDPGTWAMMLLGFGVIGFSMRRRRRDQVRVRYAF